MLARQILSMILNIPVKKNIIRPAKNTILALNVQFIGGFFQISWEDFSRLLRWKLQSGVLIIDTECVRFTKIGGIFYFLQN